MSLTRVFNLTVLLLGGAAVAVTTTLILLGSLLHRTAAELEGIIVGIHAAEELEAALLLHNRLANRYVVTGEPELVAQREHAERDLRARLVQVRRLSTTPDEAELVATVEGRLRSYLRTREELEARGAGPLESYRTKGPFLESAVAALERLIERQVNEGRAARAQARRWDALSNVLGATAVVTLVLLALTALAMFRRLAVRPVALIGQAVRRFAAGDRSARAPEHGADELAQFARTFNDMAATLERQRHEQLAFLGGVAHDLRNPLQPLKLAVTAAAEEGDDERARRALRTVSRQVERLERMIGDLLDMTRLEAGELELVLEERDARELLDDVLELHRMVEDHELVASFPDSPVPLRCDPVRVEQVLTNLLSNAMKYSPRGARVELALRREADEAVFTVRDHGVGISATDQLRIFLPFRRAAASARDVPGVGLGLPVTKRIVEAHGGRIEVESTPGEGSTFRVRLPMAPSPAAPAPAAVPR